MEADIYKQIYEQETKHWWYRGMLALCQSQLKQHVFLQSFDNIGCTILDVGCGTGYWTKNLLRYGRVFALDNAQEALEICRKRGLRNLIKSSADALPFVDKSCDLITVFSVIEHLDKDRALIEEVQRVLKPDGYGIFLTSAYMFLWSKHDEFARHKRRYTEGLLNKMIGDSGLEIVKISYVNTFLFLPILLVRVMGFKRLTKRHENTVSPDLFAPPKLLNNLFYLLLRLESWLLKWMRFPFGVNLLVLIRRKV